MKPNLVLGMAVATFLFPTLVSAELIHYKGTRRDYFHGEGRSRTFNSKVLLVVDWETAHVALFQYGVLSGQKIYAVYHRTNLHFVRITGAQHAYTAITRAPSDCAREEGNTDEGVYCSGMDAQIAVKAGTTFTFPRLFKAAGEGVTISPPGNGLLFGGAWQATHDRPGTLASNEANESFSQAVERFTRELEAQGYRQ